MVAVARSVGPGMPGNRRPGCPGKLRCPLSERRHGFSVDGGSRSIGGGFDDDCRGRGWPPAR